MVRFIFSSTIGVIGLSYCTGKQVALPSHLPRANQAIDPEDKQEHGTKIGESVTELLEYRSSKMYVKRYVRPKYVQSHPDPAKDQQVVVAPLHSFPIP